MTMTFMRSIDRYAGVPLCWISGALRMLSKRRATARIRTVLVIKFFGMGSIVLATPTLRSLRSAYPQSRIIFLTFSQNEELLRLIPSIDECWLIDPGSVRSFVTSLSRVVGLLLRSDIDVVLDLEFFSKFSTLLGAIARPGMHVGFALPTRWRTSNLTHPIRFRSDQHVTHTFHDVLGALGIRAPQSLLPCLSYGDTLIPLRAETVELTGSRKIICINPNAGQTSLDRRWSRERFAQTAAALRQEYPEAIVCLTGSLDEREYVQGIFDLLDSDDRQMINLAGMLSLKDLIALFSRSAMLITNDSGPMHLAAAAGLPTVAIFGPESPAFYGPVGNGSIHLYSSLPCSPCLNVYDAKKFVCPHHQQCLQEISVDEVLAAVRNLWKYTDRLSLVEAVA